jgi:hypothetical protein
MLVGVIANCGATPVPVSETAATALVVLLVTLTLPLTLPLAVGAKVTEPATLVPAAMFSGRVNPLTEYPLPEGVIAEIVRVPVPELRRVNACVEVAPVFTLPKAMLVGVIASCGATPVPVSETAPTAVVVLLVMLTLPVTLPAAVGAKLTDPATLAPAAMFNGRLNPVTVKPVPVGVMADTVNVPVPELVSVKGRAEVVPVFTLPNAMLVGLTESCGAIPVPVTDTGETAVDELLVKLTLPVTLPLAVGANFTEPATLAPAAMFRGSVKPETETPAPDGVMAETVRAAVPVLRSVSACVEDVPVVTLPNAIEVGETVSVACVPVPVNATVAVGALLVTVMLPVAAPAVLGSKLTVAVAAWPAAKVKGTLTPE